MKYTVKLLLPHDMRFYTFKALSQFCALFYFHDDFNPKAVTYSNRVLHSDTGPVYIYLNKCSAY